MKKLVYKLLLIVYAAFTSLAASSKPSSTAITLTPSVTSIQSGATFYLDAQVSYDAACGTPSLQMVLPANVSFVSIGAHPWGPFASVSSGVLTITFTNPPLTGSVITNFQVNLKMQEGVVCNNTPFNFQMNFITPNCGTVTSNLVTITGLASLQVNITSMIVTGSNCVGGYMYYDIVISSATSIGAYNLTNAQITFNTNGATCLGVGVVNSLNIVTSSQPFIVSGNNITFNIGNLLVTNGYLLRYRIGLAYPCSVFTAPYNGNHTITLSGINPCNTLSTVSIYQPVSLPSSCCSSSNTNTSPYLLQKTLSSQSWSLCPGSCYPSTYSLTFNNVFGNTTYTGVELIDSIPPQINVTAFTTDAFSQYAYGSIQIQYQKNGVTTWLNGPLLNSSNVTTNVNSLPGWSPTDYVSKVKWIFNNPIPPGMVINNSLFFFIINPDRNNNPVLAGNNFTNVLFGQSSSPVFFDSINSTNTVVSCPPALYKQKYIWDNGIPQTNINALPGDTVTFRIVLNNYGNTAINNITTTDVLNSSFNFVPGSDKYFLGNTSIPSSALLQNLVPYNSSSPPTGAINFTQTGSTLGWNIPMLPGSCTSNINLVIEFKVVVNSFTVAGNYSNACAVTVNSNTSTTSPVFVNVNEYYRAVPQMLVRCPLNGNWDSTISVKPGDIIQFKYKIKNMGNVGIKSIRLVNQKPMLSDMQVVNYTTARNSQFNIDYDCSFSPVTVPPIGPTPVSMSYDNLGNNFCRTDVNIPGMPGGCSNPSWSASCNTTANDLKISLNPNFVLAPGNDVDVIVQGKVSTAATLGQIAINSFGFIGIRTDLNILTTSAESNTVQIVVDTAGCYTPPPPDTCHCGEWIRTYWQYMNLTPVVTHALQCGNNFNVVCNQPIMIMPSYSCTGPNCTAQYSLSINNVNYTYNGNSFSNIIFNASGSYNAVLIAYCNGKACDTCRFTIQVECPEQCNCQNWNSITLANNQQSSTLQCNGQYNVNCNSPYTFTFNYNCSGPNCTPKYYVKMNPPGGPFTLLTGNTFNYTFTATGWYSLTVVPICGTDTCAPCTMRFFADCQTNECHCGEWGTSLIIPKPLPNVDFHPFPAQCEGTYTLSCNQVISIKPQFYCLPSGCNTSYTMTINNVNYFYNSVTGTFDNISFSSSGIYTAIITPICNGVACSPCKIYFHVDCGSDLQTDCCKNFKAQSNGSLLTYTGNGTQNLSLTGINVSGINPSKVTISIVSASTSGSSCGQNGPVAVGITGITTNTTGLTSINILQQPYGNDISLTGSTWNNNSNFSFTFNAPLKPGCSDTLKICLKFTFYDKDCKACSVYKCFTVARKWKKVVGTSVPINLVNPGAIRSLLASLNDLEKQLGKDNSNTPAINNAKLLLSSYRNAVLAFENGIQEREDQNTLAEKAAAMNMQFLALQDAMQKLSSQYTTISNVLKTKHETVKNSISNIR